MNSNGSNPYKLGALADGMSTYERWASEQGVPIVKAFFIQNLNEVALGLWERKGGRGAIINLEGTGDTDDAYICEISAGGKSSPERHLYEELVYVLEGRGATTIWQEGGVKQTFEWQAGSLFVIPLNAWFQHFNGSGDQTARYIAFTSAPLMMNLLNDREFIFNCPYVFRNRFDGETDYFKGEGSYYGERIWDVNFIANIHDLSLKASEERGRGNRTNIIEIGCSALIAHMSQFSVGRYKRPIGMRRRANHHLEGSGYSLLWPEGAEPKRCHWQPNNNVSRRIKGFTAFQPSEPETAIGDPWNTRNQIFKDTSNPPPKGGTPINMGLNPKLGEIRTNLPAGIIPGD